MTFCTTPPLQQKELRLGTPVHLPDGKAGVVTLIYPDGTVGVTFDRNTKFSRWKPFELTRFNPPPPSKLSAQQELAVLLLKCVTWNQVGATLDTTAQTYQKTKSEVFQAGLKHISLGDRQHLVELLVEHLRQYPDDSSSYDWLPSGCRKLWEKAQMVLAHEADLRTTAAFVKSPVTNGQNAEMLVEYASAITDRQMLLDFTGQWTEEHKREVWGLLPIDIKRCLQGLARGKA